jgi:hypothetical protein
MGEREIFCWLDDKKELHVSVVEELGCTGGWGV